MRDERAEDLFLWTANPRARAIGCRRAKLDQKKGNQRSNADSRGESGGCKPPIRSGSQLETRHDIAHVSGNSRQFFGSDR
ncbi:hypothetical protein, partial [Pseudomonas amygdali]|uniref:hypothetical protein n=1 Tax=Pseudomonas amygdali TaxID=47877 RepID=UPI0019D3EB83